MAPGRAAFYDAWAGNLLKTVIDQSLAPDFWSGDTPEVRCKSMVNNGFLQNIMGCLAGQFQNNACEAQFGLNLVSVQTLSSSLVARVNCLFCPKGKEFGEKFTLLYAHTCLFTL